MIFGGDDGMNAHTWPGAELASARSIEQVVKRQCCATLAVGAAAVVWYLGPFPGAGPLLGYFTIGVAVAVIAEAVVAAAQRDRGDRCADDLIEHGFEAGGRIDPVSRAVQARIADLCSTRNRRRLADALRWQLELEARPAHVRARYPSPATGLVAHAGRVERIAAAMEDDACDPRVPIRVARLLTTPPPAAARRPDVADALRAVERLLPHPQP
jgi:hypothetical protein